MRVRARARRSVHPCVGAAVRVSLRGAGSLWLELDGAGGAGGAGASAASGRRPGREMARRLGLPIRTNSRVSDKGIATTPEARDNRAVTN